jgi:AraC-like DNA-binding protein/predicted transcriptional regulator YdeE
VYEWYENVQQIIEFIERNLDNSPSLSEVSEGLFYSPFYCTKKFHALTGMRLRDYIRLRKICKAALELRDTERSIAEIALDGGFSSQAAFSRSFKKAYSVSPKEYRSSPGPIPLLLKRIVYDPCVLGIKRRCNLSEKELEKIKVKVEVKFEKLPAHKFIGIRNIDAKGYFHFWELQESVPNQGCHTVTGLLESIPSLHGQIGGWYFEGGKRGYLYGIEVPIDYCGEVPEGMECTTIPESEYVVFYYPPYVFEENNDAVMSTVNDLAWSWNPVDSGFEWNAENPIYQRCDPEKYGYAFCRPVRPLKK